MQVCKSLNTELLPMQAVVILSRVHSLQLHDKYRTVLSIRVKQ